MCPSPSLSFPHGVLIQVFPLSRWRSCGAHKPIQSATNTSRAASRGQAKKLGLLAAHRRGHPTQPPRNQPRTEDASHPPMWQPPTGQPTRPPASEGPRNRRWPPAAAWSCVCPILQPRPLTTCSLPPLPHTCAHVSAWRAPGTVTVPAFPCVVSISSILSRDPRRPNPLLERERERIWPAVRLLGTGEARAAGG